MTCAQGLLRLLWGGARSWSATGLVASSCQIDKHGTNLLFCLKRILNVLRKQNDLIYGRLFVSKSSLFLWEQEIDYWFDAIVDQSFEDLVGDAEQRDGMVAL